MYHLYRDEIRTFRRFGNILELCSEREILFTSDNRIFRSRFILICHDDDAAAATEYAMQAATKVYFGLGEGIKGIIHRLEDSIDAVGADEALIRKYCCSADEELDPFFPSRHRRKFYSIRRKQA